jgi:predicted DNA-binding protein with PD1-like motif
MQYSEGHLGRVFVVRIDDGEDFLSALQQFVFDKKILTGTILFLGALKEGKMVTGPEELTVPPVPHFVMFEGGWETFGVGTIYPGDSGPMIHYHASVGRAGHALTGCLREKATAYLVIEAVILELTGLNIRREFDEKMQLHLPVHAQANESRQTVEPDTWDKPAEAPKKEGVEDPDELPGRLAEIIRDLTRRPPS